MSLPTPKLVELKGGVKCPELGLGTYKAIGEENKMIVEEALKIGYRHFDTAYYYKNLEPLGETCRKCIKEGLLKREDLFIATKVWPTWYSQGRVVECVQRMLKESGFDYFDLVLLHWPTPLADSDSEMFPFYPNTEKVIFGTRDIVDVYLELETVQEKKLARAIGVSNFNQNQLERVLAKAKIVPVTNQVECHLYLAQFEMQKFLEKHGIVLTAYCPLGTRPDKFSVLTDETVKEIADKYKKTTAQIAIKWLLQRKIIAIPKTIKRERLRQNFDIFDFQISPDDMKRLNSLDRGEQGRLVLFDSFGMDKHPEYPFKKA